MYKSHKTNQILVINKIKKFHLINGQLNALGRYVIPGPGERQPILSHVLLLEPYN